MCTLLACDSDLLVDVKSRAAALCPLCFHPELPAKLAFVPYPLALKSCRASGKLSPFRLIRQSQSILRQGEMSLKKSQSEKEPSQVSIDAKQRVF